MLKIAFLFSSLAVCFLSFAQNFSLVSSTVDEIVVKHSLVQTTPSSILIDNVEYLNYGATNRVLTSELGAPALPFFTESVLLPDEGGVELLVEHNGYVEYTDVLIAPSKGSLKRNQNPSDVPYVFGQVYSQNAFYPAEIVEVGSPFILRKTRGITVKVNPYQYNPVTKVLRVYNNLTARVQVNNNVQGENELYSTSKINDAFSSIYMSHYINAQEALNSRYTPLEERGDLLIITTDLFVESLQPLVDWKIQKGIKTTIVTTQITGTNSTDIKTYIQSAYTSNPNLLYVILAGDHQQVPSHSYGSIGWEELWSDSYYAQLAGSDYYPELFVGRLSAQSISDMTTQINRTLEYEKNPATGSWMTNAIGLGSDEGAGYGDDGEADWQHLRNIRTLLQAYGYNTVYEFYDGSQGGADASGNPTQMMINNAINEGVGLFNYTGHGGVDVCSSGNYSNTDINNAVNNGKYPFVVSVACNNGTFTDGTCISEAWLRASNSSSPSGAIAAAGSSILMAWAEPMQTQDEMAEIITEAYVSNRKTTLGGLFYNSQMSMLETYNSSWTAIEVMQTWVFFGDPSCEYRNKETINLTASHVSNVPQPTSMVLVNCNTEGALVAISQNGEVLGTGFVSSGSVTINFPMLISNAPLTVTATKQNYRPYQGTVQVGDGPLGIAESKIEGLAIYPNPANDYVDLKWTSNSNSAMIELRDMSGKLIYLEEVNPNGKVFIRIATSEMAGGIYFVTVTENNISSTQKLVVQ